MEKIMRDKIEDMYQQDEKCKKCHNCCVGCDYFFDSILSKIEQIYEIERIKYLV